MKKLLGIDYGTVITGLSITDEKQIFAFGLDAIPTKKLFIFLDYFFSYEEIERIIIGLPKKLNNKHENTVEKYIQNFTIKFSEKYPEIIIDRFDERFTSKIAFLSMIELGLNKKKRKNKNILNKISATIILQSYIMKKNNS
ncbi:RuvX/YqgF family protein [Blattabacterium cuenoti]|uniref:RuvX/YqgF family protein n=1 Tax=Blattabacterium cuenoti TaxID=1653831 RepID=UPI00163D09C5|nr:RuvX/YqgF family protein [Blattabacterium cuenoti]